MRRMRISDREIEDIPGFVAFFVVVGGVFTAGIRGNVSFVRCILRHNAACQAKTLKSREKRSVTTATASME